MLERCTMPQVITEALISGTSENMPEASMPWSINNSGGTHMPRLALRHFLNLRKFTKQTSVSLVLLYGKRGPGQFHWVDFSLPQDLKGNIPSLLVWAWGFWIAFQEPTPHHPSRLKLSPDPEYLGISEMCLKTESSEKEHWWIITTGQVLMLSCDLYCPSLHMRACNFCTGPSLVLWDLLSLIT